MDVPELSIQTLESAWTPNTDGVWTWYPQPEGVSRIFGPLDGLVDEMGAYHEAGHAVAALHTGIGVDGVYLSTSPENPEFTFYTQITGTVRSWTGYAAYHAAGERAADRWLRETGLWTPERAWSVERGARSDRGAALRAAEREGQALRLTAHPWNGWTQACSWADAVLDATWGRVEAVAAALLAGGSLDPSAVARVTGMHNPSAD